MSRKVSKLWPRRARVSHAASVTSGGREDLVDRHDDVVKGTVSLDGDCGAKVSPSRAQGASVIITRSEGMVAARGGTP
jgi:hypothetical protein